MKSAEELSSTLGIAKTGTHGEHLTEAGDRADRPGAGYTVFIKPIGLF